MRVFAQRLHSFRWLSHVPEFHPTVVAARCQVVLLVGVEVDVAHLLRVGVVDREGRSAIALLKCARYMYASLTLNTCKLLRHGSQIPAAHVRVACARHLRAVVVRTPTSGRHLGMAFLLEGRC